MDGRRGFRVPDWVPEWLLSICWCCGFDDPERRSSYSSSVPLHGSSDAYSRIRDEGRREDESLLGKRSERSDANVQQHGGASTSASASRHIPDASSQGKMFKHRVSSCEKFKAKEDSRFSSLAIPTFSTSTTPWDGPPGLMDEDVCAICLEEYEPANPRNFLSCGHPFHLGCILEWEERGHNICPLCDVTVASSLGDESV